MFGFETTQIDSGSPDIMIIFVLFYCIDVIDFMIPYENTCKFVTPKCWYYEFKSEIVEE